MTAVDRGVPVTQPVTFDVEQYIANAPERTPRFTEADLRIVAERAAADSVPVDCVEYLLDTYMPEGVRIWLKKYSESDRTWRLHMLSHCRRDEMGG